MKDKGIYIFIFFVFLAVIIYSCVKKPVYPSTPLIAFSNFIRYGVNPSDPDSVALSITFEDEEGDIGFAQSDTNGIFAKGNFFGILYYDSVPNRNSIRYRRASLPCSGCSASKHNPTNERYYFGFNT